MNRRFDRFLGVDFSGGRNAGNTIWVAEAAVGAALLAASGLGVLDDPVAGMGERA